MRTDGGISPLEADVVAVAAEVATGVCEAVACDDDVTARAEDEDVAPAGGVSITTSGPQATRRSAVMGRSFRIMAIRRYTADYVTPLFMKFYLDTANVDQVAEIASWGILDGVTTNPSLVAKEGKDFKETVLKMCEYVPSVSAQVTATESAEMIKQGLEYASWHKNIVVKVPMTVEGLKTLKALSAKKIRTNTTLVFSVEQAILAAKAGATMVSPFVGRLDDKGEDGMQVVSDILDAFGLYAIETEVLVASIRNVEHVHKAMLMGAHIGTMPYAVMKELPNHPLTDAGLKKFMEDWNSIKK